MKKILIVYVSAGSGHKSAALALEKEVPLVMPGAKVNVIDALDYTNRIYKKMYLESYLNLVKYMPELWGYLYRTYDQKKVLSSIENLRKAIDKFNSSALIDYIDKCNPDLIIATHFLPLQIVSHLKKKRKINAFLAGVVTDFAVHSMWMQENVDLYFTATELVKRELSRLGQDEKKIVVTGIPINNSFQKKKNADEIKQKLGLDKDRLTLLLLSGGYGVGPIKEMVKAFDNTEINIQLIVVAGNNKKLLDEIKKIRISVPVKVFGFVNNVDELMEASDFVATKPGGLTSCEVLAKQKPMLILDPIPGQEQRNCEYLLEQGAAARIYDPADASFRVKELLADRGKLCEMKINARKISKPNASQDILNVLMSV